MQDALIKNTAILLKFIMIYAYSLTTPLSALLLQITTPIITKRHPPEIIFWFFCAMIFLPEVTIGLSKGFRTWIKEGIENSDGQLNHRDIKDLLIHYASLSSLRLFVLETLLMMFYSIQIDLQYYVIPFLGSIGLSGFTIFKHIYGKQ